MPLPPRSRHVSFRLLPDADPRQARAALSRLSVSERCVVGIGAELASMLKLSCAELRPFPALSGPGVSAPSTQQALWCWLRGSDSGELVHQTRKLVEDLFVAYELDSVLETFMYQDSRDLTGYIDGTENPKGKKAESAAIAKDGSSFVAVQTWVHDLERFMAFPERDRDRIFGRRRKDNVEMDTAPKSAHTKRTAQESFDPEAFVLRRSMPWSSGEQSGLQFVAFGKSFDAYETLLRHMLGLDDGIVDALFRFSRPTSGGYYWCPPCKAGRLVLSGK